MRNEPDGAAHKLKSASYCLGSRSGQSQVFSAIGRNRPRTVSGLGEKIRYWAAGIDQQAAFALSARTSDHRSFLLLLICTPKKIAFM